MNRRGFIAAILAAPLAAVGSFAGSHNSGFWVELGASAKPYYDAVKDFKGPVSIWMRCKSGPQKIWTVMDIHYGDGTVKRYERWPDNMAPWVHLGDGNYELELMGGDLCGSACNKG
jgi:hypothetical protein